MIEVFKTNVHSAVQAEGVLEVIHRSFPDCRANFDLQDCDRVLRVVPQGAPVHTDKLLCLLQAYGVVAEVLPDEPPLFSRLALLEAVVRN